MSTIVLETDRVLVKKLQNNDAKELAKVMSSTLKTAEDAIEAWSQHATNHGFTIYGVVLKKSNALYGYCGAREILWHDRPEVELLWHIPKEIPTDPNDDIDIETAFYIRNYIIKQFNVKNMFAFVWEKDPKGMNLAEELDMNIEENIEDQGKKWLVYFLNGDSPKLLGSLGSDDEEAIRSSIQSRRDNMLNPVSRFKSPKPRPR